MINVIQRMIKDGKPINIKLVGTLRLQLDFIRLRHECRRNLFA